MLFLPVLLSWYMSQSVQELANNYTSLFEFNHVQNYLFVCFLFHSNKLIFYAPKMIEYNTIEFNLL